MPSPIRANYKLPQSLVGKSLGRARNHPHRLPAEFSSSPRENPELPGAVCPEITDNTYR